MQQVELSQGVVEYDEIGTGPPVVLLHGLFMNHTQWDRVLPLLPKGFRYLRPVLPLGSHRLPMQPDADLSLRGQINLLAELLQTLDLREVTLVHTDWGGGLFLTAHGLDERIRRQVVLPCEAFDNFPPGLPGKMAALAARVPGGIKLAALQLRVPWLRRTPMLFGQMAKYPLSDELVRGWTGPALHDRQVRRDLRTYARTKFDKNALIADTETLAKFDGPVLVLWSPENVVMPPAHGHRLADLMPNARLVEIDDAYVLSMLDQPEAVAGAMTTFLTTG